MYWKRSLIRAITPNGFYLFDKWNRSVGWATFFKKQKQDYVVLTNAGTRKEMKSELRRYVHGLMSADEPICYIELGVYQGASLREWTEISQHSDSEFYGFDTFQGLPENWGDVEKGTFSVEGKIPEIDDERVRMIPGMFQDTLPDFVRNLKNEYRLFIHLDADLYTSTLFSLFTLYPIMKPGTVLMFDEFSDLLHEFAAFEDFTQSVGAECEVLAMTPDALQVAMTLK